MIIRSPHKLQLIKIESILKISDIPMEKVSKTKYLGVYVCKEHAQLVVNKISKKVFFLNRFSKYLSLYCLH